MSKKNCPSGQFLVKLLATWGMCGRNPLDIRQHRMTAMPSYAWTLLLFIVVFSPASVLAEIFHEKVDAAGERTAAGVPAPIIMYQDYSPITTLYYQASKNDADFLEIFGYTDRIGYKPGDTVKLHVTTTAESFDVEIIRDGGTRETVYEKKDIPGKFTRTPQDVSVNGANWPVLHELKLPADWRSGAYVIYLRVKDERGDRRQEAFFALRGGEKKAKIVQILTTSTWMAYNDWGGSNSYLGIAGPTGDAPTFRNSLQRPWARGFVHMPPNSPHDAIYSWEKLGLDRLNNYATRYDVREYAYFWGYSMWAHASGWAMSDRPFAVWAEQNGYELDYVTQHDLHFDPQALDGYDVAVLVGHDEYWSWEQRDVLDAFVEGGGKLVRLAGNMIWQVRLDDDGSQICYKDTAEQLDPVRDDPEKRHLITDMLDHRWSDRPATQTFAVNGYRGIYANTGGAVPRNAGFTVYRPEHWVFEGTDLYYGDSFGKEVGIVGYEIDGLEYRMAGGRPEPTEADHPLPGTLILALTPAGPANGDIKGHDGEAPILAADSSSNYPMSMLLDKIHGKGNWTPEMLESYRYGAGMIVWAPKGKGEIFTAGTINWAYGLKFGDRITERITRNVLDRYTGAVNETEQK